MFESILGDGEGNALTILKQDHDKVKELFDEFKKADDIRQKKNIAAKAIMELKIHATIEEEIFYPAVRPGVKDKALMNEANEEHHIAKLLIAELDQMDASDEYMVAKFTVLSENIEHHVKEEENDMFPQVRAQDIDLDAIGARMLARKQQLKEDGIPASLEEKMVQYYGMKDDSPADNAQKKSGAKIIALKRPASTKKSSASKKKPVAKKPKPAKKSASSKKVIRLKKPAKAKHAASKKKIASRGRTKGKR